MGLEQMVAVVMEDPLWVAGALAMLLLPVVFFGTSLVQRFREEWWFHGALLVVAGVMFYALSVFPLAHETLIQYRSDWSWMYLVEHVSAWNVMTLGLFVLASFAGLSLALLSALMLWSVLTFRFDRLLVMLRRYAAHSASVVVYSASFVGGILFFQWMGGGLSFVAIERFFTFAVLMFALSFFLKSVDSAVFSQPKALVRFGLVTASMMVCVWFVQQLATLSSLADFSAQTFFLSVFVGFFVGVLFGGTFMVAFVHSRFASGPYVDVWIEQQHLLKRALMFLFFSPVQRTFSAQLMNQAIVVNVIAGMGMLHVLSEGYYLAGVCSVFAGYFVLFYFLDFQQDMLERGELVQHRSFSIDREIDHLMDEWEYHDEIAELSILS